MSGSLDSGYHSFPLGNQVVHLEPADEASAKIGNMITLNGVQYKVLTPGEKSAEILNLLKSQAAIHPEWNVQKFTQYLQKMYPLDPAVFTQSRVALSKLVGDEVHLKEGLAKIRKNYVYQIANGTIPAVAAREYSQQLGDLIGDLYRQGEKLFGNPPCAYSVAVLGSLARGEASLYPDIDSILVVEKRTKESIDYFAKLNQFVADRIWRLGESTALGKHGLRFCDGGLNPPYLQYEKRYDAQPPESAKRGRPGQFVSIEDKPLRATNRIQKLDMEASIDSRSICGSDKLHAHYVAQLKEIAKQSDLSPQDSIRDEITKMEANTTFPEPIRTGVIPEYVHVKEELFRFPQVVISQLARQVGIQATNTFERIKALKEKGIINATFADRLYSAMNHLIKLRLLAQSHFGEENDMICTMDKAKFEAYRKEIEREKKSLEERQKLLTETDKPAVKAELESIEDRLKLINLRWSLCERSSQVEFSVEPPKMAASEKELKLLAIETLPVLQECLARARAAVTGKVLDLIAFQK